MTKLKKQKIFNSKKLFFANSFSYIIENIYGSSSQIKYNETQKNKIIAKFFFF